MKLCGVDQSIQMQALGTSCQTRVNTSTVHIHGELERRARVLRHGRAREIAERRSAPFASKKLNGPSPSTAPRYARKQLW